jgi:hypothetical protein
MSSITRSGLSHDFSDRVRTYPIASTLTDTDSFSDKMHHKIKLSQPFSPRVSDIP